MSRPQFLHDKILDQSERDSAARKCLDIITAGNSSKMTEKERGFVSDMQRKSGQARMYVTQPMLN